jgi:hypothetical protein
VTVCPRSTEHRSIGFIGRLDTPGVRLGRRAPPPRDQSQQKFDGDPYDEYKENGQGAEADHPDPRRDKDRHEGEQRCRERVKQEVPPGAGAGGDVAGELHHPPPFVK